MAMINQTDNGNEAMSAINAAMLDVGSEVVVGNESGSSVASKLNCVFGSTVVTDQQSGSAFAQAVEDAFDAMEGGGDTPTPPEPADDHIKMRFLHISDTHGATAALEECRDMIAEDSDIEKVLITGDVVPYNSTGTNNYNSDHSTNAFIDGDTLALLGGYNKSIYNDSTDDYSYPEGTYRFYENGNPLTNIDGNGTNKLLYVLGNHDKQDARYAGKFYFLDGNDEAIGPNFSGTQLEQAHQWVRYLLGNSVNFGSATNCAYWYKDFVKTAEVNGETVTKVVRVIGLDDYERASGQPVWYTQGQVDWFMNLLADASQRMVEDSAEYYILVMSHESPFKEASGHAAAVAMRPQNATEANGEKLFVSELKSSFHERSNETNVNLFPMIMKAYLESENLNTTYTNNIDSSVLNVIKDFSGVSPAIFVGWLCGHTHEDYAGYIPFIGDDDAEDYSDQLLLGVSAADSNTLWSSANDLLYNINSSNGKGTKWATEEPTYCINELIIDFTANTITIKRHGNKTTANVSGRNYGGRVRDDVTFPLVKPTE